MELSPLEQARADNAALMQEFVARGIVVQITPCSLVMVQTLLKRLIPDEAELEAFYLEVELAWKAQLEAERADIFATAARQRLLEGVNVQNGQGARAQ